jgi:hypothetical protein
VSSNLTRGRGVLDTTLCDKVCQWLAVDRWISLVSSTIKTDRHDIAEILLKVALNTITLTLTLFEFNTENSLVKLCKRKQSSDKSEWLLLNAKWSIFSYFMSRTSYIRWNAMMYYKLSAEAAVFHLTQAGLEPTVYRNRGEHANHYTTEAVQT